MPARRRRYEQRSRSGAIPELLFHLLSKCYKFRNGPDEIRAFAWRDMAKEFAQPFYKSRTWQDCRNGYAAYRGHLCERCLRRGVLAKGDIVHHKIELTPENISDPNISLDWTNLELLCRFCHSEVHDQRKNCRRFSIGPDGEVIIHGEA